jgi:hypothetical protein
LGQGNKGSTLVKMRALFTIYLGGIVIAIGYFATIGLTHH